MARPSTESKQKRNEIEETSLPYSLIVTVFTSV